MYLAQDNNSILDTDLNLNNNNGGLEIPIYLLRYPPIAYLLNSHLSILNYVKDCPLKSIQNKVLLTIESFLNSTCRLILEKAPEIRAKGDKYLGDAYQKKGEKAKTSSSTMTNTDRLDYLYVDAIGRELIPHLLLCYECIYNTRNSKIREQYLSTKYSQRKQTMCNSVGNSNDSNVNTNTTIEFLINNSDDYKDLLSELSLPVMDRLWSLLLSTKMLTTIERKKIAKIPLKKQVVPRYTDTNSATNSTVDGNSAKVVDSSEESAFSFTEKQKQETSPTVKNDFEQSARGKKD